MAEASAIEWCDSTFNPWIGCTRVSPGCDHCYAAVSTPARTLGIEWGPHAERRRTAASTWHQVRRWNAQHEAFRAVHGRRRRVFCASLADVFDNAVPAEWRADLFQLISETPHLDWLLLTKRVGNVRDMLPVWWEDPAAWPGGHRAHANVWLGVTVTDQAEADRDVPRLLAMPAAVRFLSIEPMLGPIELGLQCENWSDEIVMDPETGAYECCKACDFTGIGNAIDWVICGGESGTHARPMHPDWARQLRDQCEAAGVPFLFKQWGEFAPNARTFSAVAASQRKLTMVAASGTELFPAAAMDRVGKAAAGRVLDGRTHDEFPIPPRP